MNLIEKQVKKPFYKDLKPGDKVMAHKEKYGINKGDLCIIKKIYKCYAELDKTPCFSTCPTKGIVVEIFPPNYNEKLNNWICACNMEFADLNGNLYK